MSKDSYKDSFSNIQTKLLWATAGATIALLVCFSFTARPSAPPKPSEQAKTAETQLWTCGMHPQVIREEPGDCPICHMKLTPMEGGSGAGNPRPAGREKAERKIKYWWDPMLNPPYISEQPGKSPMGMDLIPVYEDEAPSGSAVTIDPAVVQNMGVKTTRVTAGTLSRTIRAVGYLKEAEPNIRDVNLLVSGWIKRLYADTEGMHVKAGEPLFELYSPELRVGVDELIAAKKALSRTGASNSANVFYHAATRKLQLWGLDREQIEKLSNLDKPGETVTFLSPITGHVVKKAVVEGAAVKAGDQVLQIVNHSTLWLDAQVFERDLSLVSIGQNARAVLPNQPGVVFEGNVIFIHPHLDMMTRTVIVRLAVPNKSLHLRPGMFATVTLETEVPGKVLLVPREVVIDTGTRQVAFTSLPGGHFEAREVQMGLSGSGGLVEIRAGLLEGEQVVVSGQFLLDAESRLREAVQKFLSERKGTAGNTAPEATEAAGEEHKH